MEFYEGQKVKVLRIKSAKSNEYEYGPNYPKLGWTGILIRPYDSIEWVIKWDNKWNVESGDLIRIWMLQELPKRIIKPYGIVKFLTGEIVK